MSINSENVTTGPYTGNGTTSTFSYDFPIQYRTELNVFHTDTSGVVTLLTVDTDYDLTGVGDPDGGTITLTAGVLATGNTLFIRSARPNTQPTTYANNSPLFPETIGENVDRLTVLMQQLNALALKMPPELLRTSTQNTLPSPSENYVLGWDATGKLKNFSAVALGGLVNTDAGQVTYTPASTGAAQTNVQTVLRRKVYAQDYDTYQHAINAGDIIEFSAGDLPFSTQITVPAGKEIIVRGVFKPTVNASVSATALFLCPEGDVSFKFKHKAGFDFAGYTNWNGIRCASSSDMVEDFYCSGGVFKNIGLNKTDCEVISLSGVRNGEITKGKYKNCGVIGNVSGGGTMIYTDNCENIEIFSNRADYCGSTFINSSCGLNNRMHDNHAKYITLFPFKGGYGIGPTITNHVTPTLQIFSVAKTASALRILKVGQCICIPRNGSTKVRGIIKYIADNTSYLLITLASSTGTAVVGEVIQPLDTGAVWDSNSSTFCGDNGFDQNGVADLTIINNNMTFSGWYQDAGVFPGLRSAIWVGYDAQGSLNSMLNTGVRIQNNTTRHTFGSSVQVFVSDDVKISGNGHFDYNEGQDPGSSTPTYGGVDVGRTGFYINSELTISNEKFNSPYGYAIFAGFTRGVLIENCRGLSGAGIKLNSLQQAHCRDNSITTSKNGTYCYLISNDSGTNLSSTIRLSRNKGYALGTGGNCFNVTDTTLIELQVDDDNEFVAANSSTVRYNDPTTSSGTQVAGGYSGHVAAKPFRFTLEVGQTITLGTYFSDSGTSGCMRVTGVARNGTSAGEVFDVIFHGSTATSSVAFTSRGSTGGGAFLAAGDFTTTLNSPTAGEIVCKYTNNEANSVSMTLWLQAFGRF